MLETSDYEQLLEVVRSVRKRWRVRNILKGLALLVAFGLATLVVAAWGMEYFKYSPLSVTLFRFFSYLALLGLALRFLYHPLAKRVKDEQVALYIEEHDNSVSQAVSSAVEIGKIVDNDSSNHPRFVSKALVKRLVEQTVERCELFNYGELIEKNDLKRNSALLLTVALCSMGLILLSPNFLRNGVELILNPMRSAMAASPYSILVDPGPLVVARGSDHFVTARLNGFKADRTDVFVKEEGNTEWFQLPMNFDEKLDQYEFMFFDLKGTTQYYVESEGVRSERFRVDVTDLPYVRRIDQKYHFPAYTGLPPQLVKDGGDIAAILGTEVSLTIIPTFAVSGGLLRIEGDEPIPLVRGKEGGLSANLKVTRDSFFQIELLGFDGFYRPSSPNYVIEVLKDQPPLVTFVQPGRDTKVNPIEELFTEVRAEDDYGLSTVQIVYSVNGAKEKLVSLYSGKTRKEMVAGYTFFLEDLDLTPGDFVSYYARANDERGGPATATDIYFIEARPFNRRYTQAPTSISGDGISRADGALSVRQREIVSATYRLIRDKHDYDADDWNENLTTVALMQGRLREQVLNLLRRMTNRGITEMKGDFEVISDSLKKAVVEMSAAEESLVAKQPETAMSPEQRALSYLQRADAVFRELQVSFQENSAGGDQASSAEDLADLFELELDQLQNQYETFEGRQQKNVNDEVDEALERLQELAKRQQQENERMRQRANRLGNNAGRDGTSSNQREIADETKQLARNLERLARENALPELQNTASRLEQASNSMRRAGASSEGQAIAEGLSALEQLKNARRSLGKNKSVRFERELEDAIEKAGRVSVKQKQLQSEVEQLGLKREMDKKWLQSVFEQKDELFEEVSNLENHLDRMAQGSRRKQKEASRKIQDAANSIRSSKLKEKIRYSKGVVQSRSGQFADKFETVIQSDVESLKKKLQEAFSVVAKSDQDQVVETIERAGDLVRNIESLADRLRALGEEKIQNSEVMPESIGQQQEEKGTGKSDVKGARGLPMIGADADGARNWKEPRFVPIEDVRQFKREFRERVNEASGLGEQLLKQKIETPVLKDIIRSLERLDKNQLYLEPDGLAQLEGEVLASLKQFEYWLRQKFEGLNEGELLVATPDQVPLRYRDLVEDYFRSLSQSHQR